MAEQYVKFNRGSQKAFEKLTVKNNDTLYFITNSDGLSYSIYLGDKAISSSASSLSDAIDVVISEVQDKQLLAYDSLQQKWVNTDPITAIGIMQGATESAQGRAGLVPAPGAGQDNLFLRGDGTWAPAGGGDGTTVAAAADGKSIDLGNDTYALHNFEKVYYAWDTDHYTRVTVDEDHPWKADLEPKVVSEGGVLVLGWFEPNPTVEETLRLIQTELDLKIDADDVYSKDEIDLKLSEVNKLKRKVFDDLDAAKSFAEGESDADQYVYLIKNGDSYDEYIWDGAELKKVGTWDVDLSGYVTAEQLTAVLDNKVDKVEGSRLMTSEEGEKLAGIETGAQKNYISAADDDEFSVTDGKLAIKEIAPSKIVGLTDLLNNTATKEEVKTLSDTLGEYSGTVVSLTAQLNAFKEEYADDKAIIMDAITWGDLED